MDVCSAQISATACWLFVELFMCTIDFVVGDTTLVLFSIQFSALDLTILTFPEEGA